MAAEIKFHLDECVPAAVATGLRRRGIDVTTTGEERLLQASDEGQLAYAGRHHRVLVTQDADFLRIHGGGASHHGIVYYEAGRPTIGSLIKGLVLIHSVLSPKDMEQHLEFL